IARFRNRVFVRVAPNLAGYYVAEYIFRVWDDSTGVEIENVVLHPIYEAGFRIDEDAENTVIRNVSIIGPGDRGMTAFARTQVLVENCIFQNFEYGIRNSANTVEERYNCFEGVSIPTYGFEMSNTDLVGSTGIELPDFLPPAGSIVVDAGNPFGEWNLDGTPPDIGAVTRYSRSNSRIHWSGRYPAHFSAW
ncbi:right-handed parallel beta-helix repeat-containing protein, partial [Patescibacteria group bacterium]